MKFLSQFSFQVPIAFLLVFQLVILVSIVQCGYPLKHSDELEAEETWAKDGTKDNEEAIQLAKASKVLEAKEIWKAALADPKRFSVPMSNLTKLYYLMEEYDEARKELSTIVTEKKLSLEQVKDFVRILEKENRSEEKALFLDSLGKVKGFEFYSYEELGKYFLAKKNLKEAEANFQAILEANAYHPNALQYMCEIRLYQENWRGLLEYAKALKFLRKPGKDASFYLAKANLELGKAKTALEIMQAAPEEEKMNRYALEVWRDATYAISPTKSTSTISEYFKRLKDKGDKEEDASFLPTSSKEGQELLIHTFQGR